MAAPAVTDDPLVLTIDAGGSSVKATVCAAGGARTVASARRPYRAMYDESGRAEFDPATWWGVILEVCRAVVARADATPNRYLGITCTGMRAPFVLVDPDGEPLAPGVLVPDRRGAAYLAEIEHVIDRRSLHAVTGHWLSSRFGLSKLLWFKHEASHLLERANYVLQFHDWLIRQLSGVAVSEPSSASMSQLLDVRRRVWASELLSALGVPERLLPPLVDAGVRVGGLRAGVAAEIGLAAGTPVHAGGGDTHFAALGAQAADPGTIAVVAGSTTAVQLTEEQLGGEAGEHAPLVSAHLRPGRYACETNAGETGVMYRWLCETVAPGADDTTLEQLAENAPVGSGGVMLTAARPRWGETAWSRLAPVTIFGVRPEHTAGHLVRAAIECAAYSCGSAVGVLAAAADGEVRVCAVGGAARSALWAQTLADVLDRPVEATELDDAAGRAGALLLCLDRARTQADAVPTRRYEPDPGRHRLYAALAERYVEVFSRLDAAFGEPA
jgi:sugar (pentulose or hexulose) kinase